MTPRAGRVSAADRRLALVLLAELAGFAFGPGPARQPPHSTALGELSAQPARSAPGPATGWRARNNGTITLIKAPVPTARLRSSISGRLQHARETSLSVYFTWSSVSEPVPGRHSLARSMRTCAHATPCCRPR